MRGGAKPYLPLPPEITSGADLKANMDFIYVSCHGSQDGNVFLVPNDTFILFRGPSGVSIPLAKTEDEILNKVKYLPSKKGANENSVASLQTKKDAWWNETFRDIESKEFLKQILYNPADPEAPMKTSVYTPGDVIQNLQLHFNNDSPIFFLVGLYELPMRRCLRDDLAVLNKEYFEKEEELGAPIVDKFLREQGYAAIANSPREYKDKLKIIADFEEGAKAGVHLTEYLRTEFLKLYSAAVGDLRSVFTLEQYNISNCPGRADNKLEALGIGPIPCNPIPPETMRRLGLEDECGSAGVARRAAAPAGALAALASPGGAAGTASPYEVQREISLHELVTTRIRSGGVFTKKYKFILIEACRALPGSYLEMQEMMKYGIRPKGIGFNEAATLELQAREGKPIERAQRLYRSRRYSLDVRESDACFTTLLRLSRDRLRLAPATPTKAKLLNGEMVSIDEFDALTSMYRQVNRAVRALPANKQFMPYQTVSVSGANGSMRQGIIQGAVGALGVPNVTNRPVSYSVRMLGNGDTVVVEDVAPNRLTRANASAVPPATLEKLKAANLPFSSVRGLAAPNASVMVDILTPTGKTFQTDNKFRQHVPALMRLIDDLPFRRSFQEVFLKYNPSVLMEKQRALIGTRWQLTGYVEPDMTNPASIGIKYRIQRDNPATGKLQTTLLPSSLLALTSEEAIASKPAGVAGGARGKSRSKLSGKLCRCIKEVRKTVKVRKGSRGGKESAAIGICVRSVLGKRGRTLRKFKCGKKAYVETQSPLKKKDKK